MRSMVTEEQLQNYLHRNIPLSVAMGVSVVSVSVEEVVLSAPLAPNINHKSTVFGGSLAAVATLSCWSLLYANLQQVSARYQIVVTHSEIQYFQPVHHDFEARCSFSDKIRWKGFLKRLHRMGKARIQLKATIGGENDPAVGFQGTFAALSTNRS